MNALGLLTRFGLTKPPASGGGGDTPASSIPAATDFRLTAYETWGSTIADISEVWLGSDSATRFASAVTTEKSAGGSVDGIVDDSLTDTGNNQSLSGGCWWELSYASPESLAYAKVARPNTTSTRRLRTWAVRLYNSSLAQWITALARGNTDDMSSAATYASFDLASEKVIVRPLLGNSAGYAIAAAAVSGGATLSVNRPSYVEANDAVLLAWGNVGSGGVEYPITAPAGVTTLYNGGGLLVALRTTDANAGEAASYSATNADASQRSMAAIARTLHNVDPGAPGGDTAVATNTKSAPSIEAASNQAVVVIALYDQYPTDGAVPSGYTLIGGVGRSAGAGTLSVLAGMKAGQESGIVSPGDFGGTDTPIRIVTIALNASTP